MSSRRVCGLIPGARGPRLVTLELEDGRICAVHEGEQPPPDRRPYDRLARYLLLPGLVDAHAHSYSLPLRFRARLRPAPPPPAPGLEAALTQVWWPLDRVLTAEALELAALLTAREALAGGVTTLFDHVAAPYAGPRGPAAVAAAYRRLGLRATLAWEVSDREGEARGAELVDLHTGIPMTPLLRPMLGLHAAFTVGPATLERAARTAQALGIGVHVHLGEGPEDRRGSRLRYGADPWARLAASGLLDRPSVLAHAVDLTSGEWAAVAAEPRVWVITNPHSNLTNRVGTLPWERVPAAARVGVGTDGFAAGPAEAALLAGLLHAGARPPGALWEANHALAAAVFDQPFGGLEPGAAADLVAVEPPFPFPRSIAEAWTRWAAGAGRRPPVRVYVAGEPVAADGRPLHWPSGTRREAARVLARMARAAWGAAPAHNEEAEP
ncbi:MAG: amidohydrolase family protein [Firmicutes bacterium]|nr:amidohydrolase family protein [Bacillota bacterium]